LLTLEAMKMETTIYADRDGTLAEVLVKAGDRIDAKDLLITYAEAAK
jgi:pyruvate carboxylase